MASRASNWNHEELRKLVELWADVSIQAIMDSKQKNTRAYDKIKVRLAAAGFIRTVAQIERENQTSPPALPQGERTPYSGVECQPTRLRDCALSLHRLTPF